MTTLNSLPTHARAVIIGGGVIGASIAYHLAKLGWDNVILLERKQLTCGTTWHAAGLIATAGFGSETLLFMARYTRDLYMKLEEETGQATGFKQVGLLQIVSDKEWLENRRRSVDYARAYGIDYQEISPKEVKEMWPLADTRDVIAGFFCQEDGRINPIDVTMALAKGARMGGVKIFEETEVTGVKTSKGRVSGVVTDKGEIEAEVVVNAAGMWGRQVGRMAGVDVPLQANEHYYLITEPIEGVHPDLPVIEDPDHYSYIREEVGGLMVGLFEPLAAPWAVQGIPKDFAFGEIRPDWDRMMPYIEAAMERIPVSKNAGVHKFFCGPESFTPDLSLVMGEAPGLKNFYVAAGLNSLGILLGGGVGQVMAQWIADGYPSVDVSEIDIRRFMPFQSNPRYLQARAAEILGMMYQNDYPNRQLESARPVRRSALHPRLAAAGAYFGSSKGWEYPDWFAPQGVEPKIEKYSWWRQNWFEYWAAEHKACREDVILMDLSLMSKHLVQGKDAEKVLNRICANDVAVEPGRIVYTPWLNERGMMEEDLTVTRLAEDQYLVISSDAGYNQTRDWLKRNIPEDGHVFVTDVTSGYAMINIQGPKSRELISRLTTADMSNQAFPYMSAREIDLHYVRALALRITYLGELGFELYLPPEYALAAYDALLDAGHDLGLRHAGIQALYSLRTEKGYLDYGHDIDNTDTPLEAGLGFAVKFDKPGGFIGREALLRQKEAGPPKRRITQFLLEDPQPLLYHNELIYCNGKLSGTIRAGSYGHTLGAAVGLGMLEHEGGVTADFVNNSKFEIQIAGLRYPARASLQPFYDPKGEKIKS
ncbi:MAG: FAD-dependent oxidoreductase [Anaerolineales bacterium]|nr:FAD-dependent oxidoreductase [Anaerolineales bacterium]